MTNKYEEAIEWFELNIEMSAASAKHTEYFKLGVEALQDRAGCPQYVIDRLYKSYNQEKWFDMHNGGKFMDELTAIMDDLQGSDIYNRWTSLDIMLKEFVITDEIAKTLGECFNTTPEFWLNLQEDAKDV